MDIISLYAYDEKNKTEIDLNILNDKNLKINSNKGNLSNIYAFILKIKKMLGLMLFKYLIHGRD